MGKVDFRYTDHGLACRSDQIKCIAKKTYFVDIAENNLLDGVVFEDLAHNSSISSSDDKNFLWVWVARKREMGDHLLVPEKKMKKRTLSVDGHLRKLIALSALNNTIKNEDVSVSL